MKRESQAQVAGEARHRAGYDPSKMFCDQEPEVIEALKADYLKRALKVWREARADWPDLPKPTREDAESATREGGSGWSWRKRKDGKWYRPYAKRPYPSRA